MAEEQAAPIAPVTARWAWLHADPDPTAGDAVAIMAASDTGMDSTALVARYPTGSPSSMVDQDAADVAPWVTFGPIAAIDKEPWLSVSVRQSWEQVPGGKRQVSPRRFFLCRFADLAVADASYQTLWRAIDPVGLPTEDGQAALLPVEGQPRVELVATIKAYGFAKLAVIATTLLQARVVLKGANGLGRDQRLALVDAVAALLPYGFRADLSASSAVKGTVKHNIRLVFGDFSTSDDQLVLSLQDPRSGLPPGLDLTYLRTLLDKEQYFGTDQVVAHLWEKKDKRTFTCPEDALDILGRLNSVEAFVEMLRNPDITRGQLLMFFGEPEAVVLGAWCHPSLSDEDRDRLMDLLLSEQDGHDIEALRVHWVTVADSVASFALRHLDEGNLEWAGWLLGVAREVPDKAEDYLLYRLLVAERSDHGGRREAALVRLLADRADPPAEDTFRDSCDELRGAVDGIGHERLVRQLLISEIARPGSSRALGWATWLCQTTVRQRSEGLAWPEWMLGLACALYGARGQMQFNQVISLIEQDPDWAVALRLAGQARQAGHYAKLLGAIGLDLVKIAAQLMPRDGQAGRGAPLADALSSGSPPLRADLTAVVDAVLVLLGRAPRDFLVRADQTGSEAYEKGLEAVFDQLPGQGPWSALERGFLDHAATTPLQDRAVQLMRAWGVADGRHAPGLARYVVTKDMATILLECDQFDGAFWEALVSYQPVLGQYASGPILRTAAKRVIEGPDDQLKRARDGTSVPASELASVMCDCYVSGMPTDKILSVLATSRSAEGRTLTRLDPEKLDSVLRQFQGLLFYEQAGNFEERSGKELLAFYRLISGGALGPDYGRWFARDVKRLLRSQIRARKRAIRALSGGSRWRFWRRANVPQGQGYRRDAPAKHVLNRGHGTGGTG